MVKKHEKIFSFTIHQNTAQKTHIYTHTHILGLMVILRTWLVQSWGLASLKPVGQSGNSGKRRGSNLEFGICRAGQWAGNSGRISNLTALRLIPFLGNLRFAVQAFS